MSIKYKFRDPNSIYFISFSVVDWIDVFVRKTYRDILIDSIVHCQNKKGLVVHAYVIMTNHVHMIISRQGSNSLEDILRDLKKFTSFKIVGAIMQHPRESRKEWLLRLFEENGRKNPNNTKYQFWQQDNHPIELTDNRMIEQKLNYIHENPVKAGFVRSAEEFTYSSANDYAGVKGYVEIEILF